MAGRPKRPQRRAEHGDIEQHAAHLDIALLDVIAQIEALLRHGRAMQRESLCVRGVPTLTTDAQRTAAAARIETIVRGMVSDQREVAQVLTALRGRARDLHVSVRRSSRH